VKGGATLAGHRFLDLHRSADTWVMSSTENRARPATIRDVAADAGLAASTVSYILAGSKRFPEQTVERVLESVAKLRYRPSPTARALSTGRTKILGLMAPVSPSTPSTNVDIFMRFVRAAMYAASPHGYDVLVMGRGEEELAGDILADALLLMNIEVRDSRVSYLAEAGHPTVLIGVPPNTHGFSAVDLDFADAMRTIVRALCDRGHTQIAVMGTPEPAPRGELAHRRVIREEFAAECARQGIMGRYLPCGPTRADVEKWLDQAQAVMPGLTGIVVEAVAGIDCLYDVARERGISIPEDVSVVAIAPIDEFAVSHPSTSVLDLPGRSMVERAVERAIAELGGEPGGVIELLPAVLHAKDSMTSPGRGLLT